MNGTNQVSSKDAIYAAVLGVVVLFGVALTPGAKSNPSTGMESGPFVQTTMCHYAGPHYATTVIVEDVALYSAHLARGDTLGPCAEERAATQ